MKIFFDVFAVKGRKGQALVEYALILVLISIVAILMLSRAGSKINKTFSKVDSAINSGGDGDGGGDGGGD